MGLSRQEQFRLGFLLRCADEGLTREQIVERVKFASVLTGLRDLIRDGATLALWKAPLVTGALGISGAALAGGTGGYMAAKMTDDEVDPESAKRQELIAAFKQHAERARRNAARLQYRGAPPRVRSPQLL